MKRNKLLTTLLTALLIITLTFSLTSCSAETVKASVGEIMQNEHVVKLKGYAIKFFDLLGIDVGQGRPHDHALYEYGFDDDEHWQICDCGEIDAIESHTFSDNGVCSVCGYTSTAHRHVLIKKEAVSPTCNKAGSIEHWACEECGKCYETEEALVPLTDKELAVTALGHDYGEYRTNSDGTHTRICTRDASHTETETCMGGEASCSAKAVCTLCGGEYGTAVAHNFTLKVSENIYLKSAAGCENAAEYYYSCSCGAKGTETYTVGEPLGHSFANLYVSNGDGTHTRVCLNDNSHTETDACSGGEISCTDMAVCDVCHAEYGDMPNHDWNSGEITAEPGCTEAGNIKYTCSECGEVKNSPIAMTGHGYESNIKKPTCTEGGYTEHVCSECGDSYKDAETDPLGHSWDREKAECETGRECTVCHETEAPLGHDYALTKSEPATCENGGYEEYTCSNCNDNYTNTVSAPLGHDLSAKTGEVLKEGETCIYVEIYYCSQCHENVTGAEVEHHSLKTAIVKEATCLEDGIKQFTCSDCGYSYEETVDSDPTLHTWDEGTVSGSVKTYACPCGETKTVVVAEGGDNATVNSSDLQNELEFNEATLDLGGISSEGGVLDGKENLTVSAGKLTDEELLQYNVSAEQLAQIGTSPVYNFTIMDGENAISDFGDDGYVTVTIPYDITGVEDVSTIAIWYISNDTPVSIPATYSNGYVTFKTNHFSVYTVTLLTPAERCELYGHVFSEKHVEGSCVADTYDLKVCIRCSHSEKEVLVKADGHDFVTETTNPTCTAAGYTVTTCRDCDYNKTVKHYATGHNYEVTEEIEATCAHKGSVTRTCSSCGDEIVKTYAQLPHTITTEKVAATCESAGYTHRYCEKCDYSQKSAYVDAKGHTLSAVWSVADDNSAAHVIISCSACDLKYEADITPEIREFVTGCTVKVDYVFKCTYNGETYTEKRTVTTDVSAHEFGTEYKHSAASHWIECKKCGERRDEAEHIFPVSGVVTVYPTCSEAGEMAYTCEICSGVKTEAIEPTGKHYYVDGVCTDCGAERFDCDHTVLTEKTLVLGEDVGTCDGVIVYKSCACGEVKELINSSFYDVQCKPERDHYENEYIGADGVQYSEMSAYCTECDFFIRVLYSRESDGCNVVYREVYTVKVGDVTLIDDLVATYTEASHNRSERTKPISSGCTCGSEIVEYYCIDCGEVTEATVRINCKNPEYGEGGAGEKTAYCPDCGHTVEFIAGEEKLGSCTVRYKETVNVYDGSELVYTFTKYHHEEQRHDYETSYELVGDSCTDGVKVKNVCKSCGYEIVMMNGGHVWADKGESVHFGCWGDYAVGTCAVCNESVIIHIQLGCLGEHAEYETFTDNNGIVHEMIDYTCKICGYRIFKDTYAIEGDEPCSYDRYTVYEVYDPDGNLVIYNEENDTGYDHDIEDRYEAGPDGCLGGWTIHSECKNCDYVKSYTGMGHMHTSEHIDLSDLGICGGDAYEYYCRICGGGRYIAVENIYCKAELVSETAEDVNGVRHTVTVRECRECGAVYTSRAYNEQIEACSYYEVTEMEIKLNGSVVLNSVKKFIYENHDYRYDVTYEGDGCTEGYYFVRYCTGCDESEEGYGYDHLYHEKGEINFADLGMCGGYAHVAKCEICGEAANADYYTDCNYEYVDTGSHDSKLERCTRCGSTRIEANYVEESESPCETVGVSRVEITFRGEIVFSVANKWYSYNHRDTVTFELKGDSCEDGYYAYSTCEVCGRKDTTYGDYHHEFPVWRLDLSDFGVCDKKAYITERRCPCGAYGSVDYSYCGFERETSSYLQNGVMHSVTVCECPDCGLKVTRDSYDEMDGCFVLTYNEITVEKGSECIVDGRRMIVSAGENHDYEYNFNLFGKDCEDGYEVMAECRECGASFKSEGKGHADYVIEKEYYSVYGACGGMFTVRQCACGEYIYANSESACMEMIHTENQYEEDGILYYVHTARCDKCGLRITRTENYVNDPKTCKRITYVEYVINVGAELVTSYSYSTSDEWHDNRTYGNLHDPSLGCEGGVDIIEECKNCKRRNSYVVYDHALIDQKTFDLRHYGAVCGGEVIKQACACGKVHKMNFDHALCLFDMNSIGLDFDIPNRVGGNQRVMGTENVDEYFYENTYLYTCAVTNPDPCGIRILYSSYWVYEGNCTARQYIFYSIDCDADGKNGAYTETVRTENTKTYHILEWQMLPEDLEGDGKGQNPGYRIERECCTECGSYYQLKNVFFEDGHVSLIEVTSENKLSTGIYKYYIRTSEQSSVDYEYNKYPVIREYTRQEYMDGRVYWIEYTYEYEEYKNYPFDSYIVIRTMNDSNGSYGYRGYSYYKGYQFEIFDYYYDKKDDLSFWWYEYDYTYSFYPECTRTVEYESRDDSYTRAEPAHPSWHQETVVENTCTQYGDAIWRCVLCSAEEEKHEHTYPLDHNFIYVDGTYICVVCGLRNLNGANGDLVLEDFTDKYGDDEYYAVGYHNRGQLQFLKYVSILIGGDPNNEIILPEIEIFDEYSRYIGVYFSRDAVTEAAKMLGYAEGDYLVKIAFVPVGSDGSHDYAVTFTDENIPVFYPEGGEVRINGVKEGESEIIMLKLTEDGTFYIDALLLDGENVDIVCYDKYGNSIGYMYLNGDQNRNTLDAGSSKGNCYMIVISTGGGSTSDLRLKISFQEWK